MKYQEVRVDYWQMIETSFIYVALAACGWILFKLVHAIFWFPSHLRRRQEKLYNEIHAVMELHGLLDDTQIEKPDNVDAKDNTEGVKEDLKKDK